MSLSFLGAKTEAQKHERAIQQLRAAIKAAPHDPRVRIQLSDVLIAAGRTKEAVPILLNLAEEFARDGFGAKAIAVLKKAQKAEPGRTDVAQALADLIQRGATSTASALGQTFPSLDALHASAPTLTGGVAFDMEEIELEAPPAPASDSTVPAADAAPRAAPESEPDAGIDDLVAGIKDVLSVVDGGDGTASIASPLFSEFTNEELVAVIAGIQLMTFEPGDILITESAPGNSLFVITTGETKAFVREPNGEHRFARTMGEGSFFGEISILTGKPRTATVTAATRVEALMLDKKTLDAICLSHPGVRSTLQRFADARART